MSYYPHAARYTRGPRVELSRHLALAQRHITKLTTQAASPARCFGSDIKWNFAKFLVGRDGRVIERYAPTASPASIEDDIRAALAEVAPAKGVVTPTGGVTSPAGAVKLP